MACRLSRSRSPRSATPIRWCRRPTGSRKRATGASRSPSRIAFRSDQTRLARATEERHAGQSVGEVKADHGWHTYAGDHFALMDHLGFGQFHVMGGCIGGSFCFEAIEQDAKRIPAAVLQNPIGLWENRDTWDAAIKGF